jgi:hypothetical protein
MDTNLLIAIIVCGSSVLLYLIRIFSKKILHHDPGTPPIIHPIGNVMSRALSFIRNGSPPRERTQNHKDDTTIEIKL